VRADAASAYPKIADEDGVNRRRVAGLMALRLLDEADRLQGWRCPHCAGDRIASEVLTCPRCGRSQDDLADELGATLTGDRVDRLYRQALACTSREVGNS